MSQHDGEEDVADVDDGLDLGERRFLVMVD